MGIHHLHGYEAASTSVGSEGCPISHAPCSEHQAGIKGETYLATYLSLIYRGRVLILFSFLFDVQHICLSGTADLVIHNLVSWYV